MSRLTIRLDSGASFRVYSNVPLVGSKTVDRAVIVVHGTDRNASDYHERMLTAARKAGVSAQTAVLAPWFESPAWSDLWKQGGRSNGMSSFQVIDQLVNALAYGTFPKLTRVTVAGHSAGGQFVQRYAAFGVPLPMQVNYVAANPSSFLYLDPWRPVLPSSKCTRFNAYKYGLERRPAYVNALPAAQVAAMYTGRRVTIVNGALDVQRDDDLDTSCAAMTQGPNRRVRGEQFAQHLWRVFPTAPHDYIVVPGVAHDSARIFADPLLRPALFGVTA